MKRNLALAGVLLTMTAALAPAEDLAMDLQRSTITIHVGKAGILSVAGHEHWISAPIASGTLGETPAPHITFTVQSAKMIVKPDPKVDANMQATIQKDMEEMTLETVKFPEIRFRSTRIDKAADGQWKVEGELYLHGVTRTVKLTAKRTGDSYSTHTTLKQTDFGIKPITIGGGAIKVKDEVEIDFQIFPRAA